MNVPLIGIVVPLAIAGILPAATQAQPYVEKETRFRFAQTYFGIDAHWTGTGLTLLRGTDEALRKYTIPQRINPRLTIGGIHFWGHADAYISFPLPTMLKQAEEGELNADFSMGVETGARLYPWRIELGRVRPFVGAGWNVTSYAQSGERGEGPTTAQHRLTLQTGASWPAEFGRLEAGMEWTPIREASYPISRTERASISLPAVSAWIGFRYMIETTAPLEQAVADGTIDRIERQAAACGDLNSLSIAAGPSTAITMSRSSHHERNRPYLDDPAPPSIFPDLAVGYYHYGFDAALNVAWRPITQCQEGYGARQELRRHALSVEAVKFLADYHGFVPFVGIAFGREWLSVHETDNNRTVTHATNNVWAPGVVAGWDIRPTRVDWFTLRTTLRYTPLLKVEPTPDHQIAFDHFEFNFIQFVLYPERLLGR